MSLFFLLNNLHFALEILGAIAFLTIAWLAFDSFLARRDFVAASRGIAFGFLALWQVFHALSFSSEIFIFVGYAFYILGVIFVLWNLILEIPGKRPEFKAIIVLPGASALLLPLNAIVTLGLFLITWLALRQYKRELKKPLAPFIVGFLFLSLGALSSIFYTPDSFGFVWMAGHLFELIGFLALGWWVWKYLELRIREEMLVVFVSSTLFMAVIVSLTFSSILLNRVEIQTKTNLLTNTRVLDFALLRLQEEALAKAKFLATSNDITQTLLENKFVRLEELANRAIEEERLGFLTVLNGFGDVLLRAQAPSGKGENLRDEEAVKRALLGESFVTIERSPVEKFSIRAASPVLKDGKVVGVIVAGFPLDNTLADNIKKITGLEMSIFDGDTRVATTTLDLDGRTRGIGIKEVNPQVLETVLEAGGDITLRTTILSRPALASYLPVKNANGRVVGMISAAKPQHEILGTTQATNRLTLIVVMIMMLILITPIYLITRRLSKEIV